MLVMLSIKCQCPRQAVAQIDARLPSQRLGDEPVITIVITDIDRFSVRRKLDLVDRAFSVDLNQQLGEIA